MEPQQTQPQTPQVDTPIQPQQPISLEDAAEKIKASEIRNTKAQNKLFRVIGIFIAIPLLAVAGINLWLNNKNNPGTSSDWVVWVGVVVALGLIALWIMALLTPHSISGRWTKAKLRSVNGSGTLWASIIHRPQKSSSLFFSPMPLLPPNVNALATKGFFGGSIEWGALWVTNDGMHVEFRKQKEFTALGWPIALEIRGTHKVPFIVVHTNGDKQLGLYVGTYFAGSKAEPLINSLITTVQSNSGATKIIDARH